MSQQEPVDLSDRYQLITKLGQGGMARVLLMMARGKSDVNKLLVVKELLPDLKEDPDFLEMFLDEARLSVRLNHPNVIQTYEVSTHGEHPVIVMEYVEGQSLMALLNRVHRDEMPMDLHLYILTQVLTGLHYAHELCDHDGTPLDVVHRDVSPQNVLVTYDGQVKLVDFGIAKAARSNRRTRTGVFKGKVTYAAPEQVVGGAVDRRCDIFSFGVMLWEALARRRLCSQDMDIVAMQHRANGEDPKIETVAPDTPEELARICNKAMAKNPDDRYATAEEMCLELIAQLDTASRIGPHEVAKLVRTAFATERSKVRQIIETRMKEMRAAASPPASSASPATAPDEVTPEAAPPSLDETRRDPEGSTAKVASLTPPLPRTGLGLRSRVLIALVAVGAVSATIAQLSRRIDKETSGSEPSAQASIVAPVVTEKASAAAVVTATAAPTVEVSIVVEPPQARVFFDDVELATNPFHGALPRSSASRLVRASAPGFVTEERLVVFDRDLRMQLQLRPGSGGPATPLRRPSGPVSISPTTGTAEPPASPRPGDLVPSTDPKKPRAIDDTF